HGWLIVLEVDDHPALLADVRGTALSALDWQRFAYCHAIQTSTERLRAALAPHNPEIAVFRNAVFDLPPFSDGTRLPRVFIGAVGPRAFSAQVAASLDPVVRQFPDLQFVVAGEKDVFDALPTRQKTYHGYLPYADYLDLMASCAVALAPLAAREFLDC